MSEGRFEGKFNESKSDDKDRAKKKVRSIFKIQNFENKTHFSDSVLSQV